MTPAEHAAEAERLLALVKPDGYGTRNDAITRRAAVHSLIAVARTLQENKEQSR